MKTKVIRQFDPETLQAILQIEAATYPPEWAFEDAETFFTELMENPEVIVILLENEALPVGVLLAEPHDGILEDFDDPLMQPSPGRYYVDELATIPDIKGQGGCSTLVRAFINECLYRGITQISMHARITNGFNAIMKRKFEVTDSRIIENWPYYNGEESTEYLEANIILLHLPPIEIKVIPHEQQRFNCAGDWFFNEDGTLVVNVSSMKALIYELAVAEHEVGEAIKCLIVGITHKQVDAFEEVANQKDITDYTGAPHLKEHLESEAIEKLIIEQHGFNWDGEYDSSIRELYKNRGN